MDLYSFIASIINTLAWPIVFVVFILILKKPLSQLLLGLSKFKYNNIEMDFGKELSKLENTLKENVKDQAQDVLRPMNDKADEVITVAEISPSAAITITWTMVEQEIISVIDRMAISPDYPPYNSLLKNITLLRDNNLIDESTYLLINELRTLRNNAVHAHNEKHISYLEAVKYYEIAIIIIDRLMKIKR